MIRIPSPLPNPIPSPLPAWALAGYSIGEPTLDPATVSGLIAGYRIQDTTRSGSSVTVWRDVLGTRDATPDGTQDTVYSAAAGYEYAEGGIRYSPASAIPFNFRDGTIVTIYSGGNRQARQGLQNVISALTNPAASGGGAIVSSATGLFYNASRPVGCVVHNTGINCLATRFDPSSVTLRSNGITRNGAVNGSTTVNEFVDIWGYAGAGLSPWRGERVAVYFYNRALTDDELSAIERFHNVSVPSGDHIIVLADSFGDGVGATTGATAYVRVLEASAGTTMTVAAISGGTFAAFSTTNFAEALNACVANGVTPTAVIDLGKNNLAANTSAATLQTTFTTWANAINATGANLIAVTIPPRSTGFSGGADAASYESQRLAYNAWLRTQEGVLFDRLADQAANATLENIATYPDGIHLNDTGHALWAATIAAEFASL